MRRLIWFVPSNSSHIDKNRQLLSALEAHGCRVRLLCLDEVMKQRYWTREQMRAGGFEHEVLPANGFRPNRHWLLLGLQRSILVNSFQRVFGEQQADAVIFGADSGLASRTAGDVARLLGIPTVLVADGLVVPPNPRYNPGLLWRAYAWFVSFINSILKSAGQGRSSPVDRLLVMNEQARHDLTRYGVDAKRIRVVGSPEYDALARQVRETQTDDNEAALRERLGLPSMRPVIFFAHQGLPGEARLVRESVTAMVRAARACGAVVLVKLHPRGGLAPETLREWAKHQGFGAEDVVIIRSECSSIEAVRLCSVCTTFFSTVSIEAMVCRKPVVFMLYHGYRTALSGRDLDDAALDAETPEELERQLVRVLTDSSLRDRLIRNAEAWLEREMFGLDGKSAERGAAAILELIEERTANDQSHSVS
jgi:nucleotide-binding universal stress UspA family protein